MTHTLFSFLVFRISMIFLFLFLLLFLPMRYKRPVSVCGMALCFLITTPLDYWALVVQPNLFVQTISTLCQIICVQATALLLCRYRDARALFTGMTAAIYVLLGNFSADVVASVLGDTAFAFEMALLAQIVLHSLTLFVYARTARRYYLEELRETPTGWGRLCLIPALFYSTAYTLQYALIPVRSNPLNSISLFLLLSLLPLSYTLIMQLRKRQRHDVLMTRRNQSLELQAKGVHDEYVALQKGESELRILRHDMRHYAQIVETYLKAGEYAKAEAALADVNARIAESTPAHFCDNIAINGVVEHFHSLALQDGAALECKLNIPAALKENEFEFAVVVSNLLENALNAVRPLKTNRVVSMRANVTRDRLLLEISNPFQGVVDISPETGLPRSHRGKGHGHGTESCAAFAEKYGATFDYHIYDHVCTVHLLMPL